MLTLIRGAEQTWQGLTVTTDNPTRLLRNIGVTKVSCNGQESVFHNCKLQNGKFSTNILQKPNTTFSIFIIIIN